MNIILLLLLSAFVADGDMLRGSYGDRLLAKSCNATCANAMAVCNKSAKTQADKQVCKSTKDACQAACTTRRDLELEEEDDAGDRLLAKSCNATCANTMAKCVKAAKTQADKDACVATKNTCQAACTTRRQ